MRTYRYFFRVTFCVMSETYVVGDETFGLSDIYRHKILHLIPWYITYTY